MLACLAVWICVHEVQALERPLQTCKSCHEASTKEEPKAPPFWMVQKRYRMVHADDEAMEKAIVEWLRQPDESKALLKGAIRNHGLMPPLEMTEEARQAAARALVQGSFEPPCERWKKHLAQGEGGMGRQAMLRMQYNHLCK